MSIEEFEDFSISLKTRKRKLDSYKDKILLWLREHPDMSSAQVYDWLQEKLGVKNIAENTVRNYVNDLREIYHIPKVNPSRTYLSVPELPMGQQMQVDFGQDTVKDLNGKSKRLYFIAFVLSHSRFKYVEWLDRPFRTIDVIQMHERAFKYFEGMTEEIVYDQDALLAVSENAGDLIMTSAFIKYQQARKFSVYLCRKNDPESKGKIEQVVKFVKYNFSKHRVFENLAEWNQACWKWLKRTGNYKIHHNIKKRHSEVHALEKKHLKKVVGTYIFENVVIESITRMIQKDNTIRFQGNRYSVPQGTYRKDASNIVYVNIENGLLNIRLTQTGSSLATHKIPEGRGNLIIDPSHRKRNLSKRDVLINEITEAFDDKEGIQWLIQKLLERYPRHIIDQLRVIQSTIKKYPRFIDDTLQEMKKLNMTSANDFRDIACSLSIEVQQREQVKTVINEKYRDLRAPERKEDIYLKVLYGGKRT